MKEYYIEKVKEHIATVTVSKELYHNFADKTTVLKGIVKDYIHEANESNIDIVITKDDLVKIYKTYVQVTLIQQTYGTSD